MRHYSKLIGLRVWAIVRRRIWLVWEIIVVVGAAYQFLQAVASKQAQGLVSIFDALDLWDAIAHWWFVLLAILTLLAVFFKAGYELWREEVQARKKAEGQLRNANEEREGFGTKLRESEQEREELRQKNEELIAGIETLKENESDATKEFFTPQKEVGGVRGSRYYKNEPIYFPDIVRELATQLHKGKGPILQELTFEDCQIHGPALLKPMQGNSRGPFFVRCEWEEDLDAFYIKDPEREALGDIGKEIGVIGLLDCVFRDCYFKGVGMVVNQETYDFAKEDYESPGDNLISL